MRLKGICVLKRTRSFVMRYLIAALLISIGLSAYGCSDSATTSPEVELASLTVDSGTIQPAFAGTTTQYSVDLANNVTRVTITALPAVAGDTVSIDGQITTNRSVTVGPAGGPPTVVSIVVSESTSKSRTYTVVLNKATLAGNNNLSVLTVSPGSLTPAFSAGRTSYSVSVGGRVDSLTVTAAPEDTAARMTINGQATRSRSISLPGGPSSTEVQVLVTAPNGTEKPYFITVNRAALSSDNNLEALAVSPGTLEPAFAQGTLAYTVEVATGITSVAVSATKSDANAVISGSLPNQGQAVIQLDGPGTSKTVSIIVTAPGGQSKTYVITVTRLAPSTDSNLSNLTVSAGSLNPSFAAGTRNYTVDVTGIVDSITVSATKSDPEAVMSALGAVIAQPGDPTGSVTVPLGLGTSTSIAITMTAENRVSTKTYTITVTRLSR